MAGGTNPSVIIASVAVAFIGVIVSFLNNHHANAATPRMYCVPAGSQYYITTLNPDVPHAKCVQVTKGLFSKVLPEIPANVKKVKWLDGHVIPGIIESHGHMMAYGEMLESVSLYDSKSVAEMKERIKAWLKEHPGQGYGTKNKWLRGVGWDQKYFGGVWPTAAELSDDPELKDLYIMLDRVDVHCVLVSEKILGRLGKTLPTAPPGGMVITDPGPGVFCDNSMDAIIWPVAPRIYQWQKVQWLQNAMKELLKVGIVGVGDAGMRQTDIKAYQKMVGHDEMLIRVRVMLECQERNTFCPQESRYLDNLEEHGKSMLMLGGVKLFADGAMGSRGAALLEPYSDKLDTSGMMLINETDLTRVVGQWYDNGYQVNVHAIGDKANRAAVNAFEKVLGPDCVGCNNRRLRIEHAQIIHPDDQKRIAKMGIIPSIQPTHATSDMAYAIDRLGNERLSKSAYRMASLFPTDSKLSYPGPLLSSDFPVEPPNPFHGMYAAVTRLNPVTGTSPSGEEGWFKEEALTVEQALLGFTKNAAYGWAKEDIAGSIEVGKWADWVVLDRDILVDKSGKSLRDVEVRETWVGGHRRFELDRGKKQRNWFMRLMGYHPGVTTEDL